MIDPLLQQELRSRFNPDGSPLRRHQLLMLDMLKKINRICVENNIKYWLSSGTCIGALRHGGFIPWDDDVDLEMLEEDFKKLRRVMRCYNGDDLVWQDSH
ncbi:LicD family protein, partial [Duncaniella dubosii]|uniref:LicD family protein n=4 Tax=Duncaniella TaxID=2518495 RepID=UPI003D6D0F2E